MRAFFGADVVLVPSPRSSPLVEGGLWPADLICRELVKFGLAARVEPALRRTKAIPKSAFAKPGERPTVTTHLESMEVVPWPSADRHVTIVDDVITKGRTLYAGCVLMQEAVPGVDVRAFGLISTSQNFTKILDPVEGHLNSAWDDVIRSP